MPFLKFNSTNNAICTLSLQIDENSITAVLAGNFGRLPTSNFILKFTEYLNGVVVGRENIHVTTRSGAVCTGLTRAYEPVPINDSATSNVQQALPFGAGSTVELVISSAFIDDIQDELTDLRTTKLDKTTYDSEKQVFSASTTGDDDYEITSSTVTTYNNGQTFKIQADVANTGPATLKLNALASKPIEKIQSGAFVALETGDIIANQIFWATYNSVEDCFQFSVDPANVTVPPPEISAIIDNTYPSGEAITEGQAVFVETVTPQASATNFQNLGDVIANKRISFPIFGAGVSSNYFNFIFKRILATTVNATVRIETDNAGSPSDTLVHADAETTIDRTQLINAPGGATDAHSFVQSFPSGGELNSQGMRILANFTSKLTSVTLANSSTATRVRLLSDDGSVLASSSVTSLIATFDYLLIQGTHYRIEADNSGAGYTAWFNNSGSYPQNKTNINYVSSSINGAFEAGTNWRNIKDITTSSNFLISVTFPGNFTLTNGVRYHIVVVSGAVGSETVDATNYYQIAYGTNHTTTRGIKKWESSWGAFQDSIFPFVSSTLFLDRVLSLTDSDYSHKVDWLGISDETVGVGAFPKVNIGGIDDNQTGIVFGSTYYLNATPGSIGTSAGANSKKIAKGHDTNKVNIIPIPL